MKQQRPKERPQNDVPSFMEKVFEGRATASGAVVEFRQVSQPQWSVKVRHWSSKSLRPGSVVELDGYTHRIVETCWTDSKHVIVLVA